MGKGASQTSESTQYQKSETNPWSPAQPLLTDLISKYGGMNTSTTPGQAGALSTLTSEAAGVPTFDTSTPINNLLSSSTAPQVGMLADALKSLNTNLAPTVDPNNLNPYNTPGFSDALKTMTSDITNATKGVYAGSGRDPSGAGSFAQSLGRGLTQGIAPVIASQFNTNRGAQNAAASTLDNAAMATAGAITGQNQVPLTNQMAAEGLIPQVQQGALLPGQLQYGVANQSYMQPYTNLAALLQPSVALGSVGQQSYGSGNSSTTQSQSQSTMGNIMGGLTGGAGLLSQMGAFGPAGWLLSGAGAAGGAAGGASAMLPLLALSDENAKDDIAEVGKLHDGQKVYRYRYKGEPTFQIGLLAQEVAKRKPRSVGQMAPGLLGVNYKTATDGAVREAA